MTRRNSTEMQMDVLKKLAYDGRSRLTHIMYMANINCSVLKGYLDKLITNGLIEKYTKKDREQVLYGITEKGVAHLLAFSYLRDSQKRPLQLKVSEDFSQLIFAPYFGFRYYLSVDVTLKDKTGKKSIKATGQVDLDTNHPLIEEKPALSAGGSYLGDVVVGSIRCIQRNPETLGGQFSAQTSGTKKTIFDASELEKIIMDYQSLPGQVEVTKSWH